MVSLLSIQILATSDEALYEKLLAHRKKGYETVLEKNAAIEKQFNN